MSYYASLFNFARLLRTYNSKLVVFIVKVYKDAVDLMYWDSSSGDIRQILFVGQMSCHLIHLSKNPQQTNAE